MATKAQQRDALEVKVLEAELAHHEVVTAKERVLLAKHEREEAQQLARDFNNGEFFFFHGFNTKEVEKRIRDIGDFVRYQPRKPITLIINSPGGSVIDGFAIYDYLMRLQREQKVEITTVARGMVASMGGVLFQAGSKRVMEKNAQLLIHKVSDIMWGDLDTLEDAVDFTKKLNDRILDILAEKATISKAQINKGWNRKDWWLNSDEALERGFCDVVV